MRWSLTKAIVLLGAVALGSIFPWLDKPQSHECKRISELPSRVIRHAGGEVDGKSYTNSMEAISKSIAQNSMLIEVDLMPSRDGDWFCFHDMQEVLGTDALWLRTADRLVQVGYAREIWFPGKKYRFEAAELRKRFIDRSGIRPLRRCQLPQLEALVREHGDVRFITDTKYDNIALLERISRTRQGFIPQVYTAREYRLARKLGFERIIYSAYKNGDYDAVRPFLSDAALIGVTIPNSWLDPAGEYHPPPAWLTRAKPILIATVNSKADVCASDFQPAAIYSDRLLDRLSPRKKKITSVPR